MTENTRTNCCKSRKAGGDRELVSSMILPAVNLPKDFMIPRILAQTWSFCDFRVTRLWEGLGKYPHGKTSICWLSNFNLLMYCYIYVWLRPRIKLALALLGAPIVDPFHNKHHPQWTACNHPHQNNPLENIRLANPCRMRGIIWLSEGNRRLWASNRRCRPYIELLLFFRQSSDTPDLRLHISCERRCKLDSAKSIIVKAK